MDKELLKKAFREYKKAAKLAYAITYPDNLGDCMSCVNYALSEKYGEDSKGIWAKHWVHGMNGYGLTVSDIDSIRIAHDITEEQAKTLYEVFGKYYNITPSAYDPCKCFTLYEKETKVYKVSYTGIWNGCENRYDDTYANKEEALRRFNYLLDLTDERYDDVKDIMITRVF